MGRLLLAHLVGKKSMNRYHWLGFIAPGILCLVALLGCNQRPAVPTVPLEPTEPVIVIVVTATSQPTLAPSSTPEATITALPTFTPVVLTTVSATARPVTVAPATRPPRTAAVQPTQKPTQEPTSSAPQPTAPPSNFPAPAVFAPEGKNFHEGETVKFEFASVGPLASNQCYRFDMYLINPGVGQVGDWWVGLCGDQSNLGDRLTFQIFNRRQFAAPNYGSLLDTAESTISVAERYEMRWTVTVVQLVKENPADATKPEVAPLGPPNSALQNTFEK